MASNYVANADNSNVWEGQIESTADPKQSGRVRVRVLDREFRVGEGGETIPEPATNQLPWATVAMPVNAAGGSGTSASSHNLKTGDFVYGFFINGDEQKRVVIASTNAVANSSKNKPADTPAPLTRAITVDPEEGNLPNPTAHVRSDQPETNKNLGASALQAMGDEGQARLMEGKNESYSPGGNSGGNAEVRVADGKCPASPTSEVENILSELFAAVQSSNGQVGSFFVSKYTGQLFDLNNIAQGYIKRIKGIIGAAVSRAFGELMALLRKGIQDLIKSLLAPLPGVLKPVVEWFQNILERLGCTMGNIYERIASFAEGILMDYLGNVVNWAACQVKIFTDGIFDRLLGELSGALNSLFGGLSSILGAIGSAVDIVGGGIASIMKILGISCSGNSSCRSVKKVSNKVGAFEGLKGGFNDLDEILENLRGGNHLPISAYCDEALLPPAPKTEVNIYGPQIFDSELDDVPLGDSDGVDVGEPGDGPGGGGPGTPPGGGPGRPPGRTPGGLPGDLPIRSICKSRKIVVKDITVGGGGGVREGDIAYVTVKRLGDLSTTTALSYYTVDGTAKANVDYCPVNGYTGFGVGMDEIQIPVQTLSDDVKEGPERFYVKVKIEDGCGTCKKCTGVVEIIDPPDNPGGDEPPPLVVPPTPGGPVPPTIDTTSPVYFLSSDKAVVYEGEEVTFTLTTINVEDGTEINATIGREDTGITFKDIEYIEKGGNKTYPDSASDLGIRFTVRDGTDTVTIKVLDDKVVEDTNEVAEQLFVTLNNLGIAQGVAVLDPLARDGGGGDVTAKTVKITADKVTMREGETVKFSIVTTNMTTGDLLNYKIFGPGIEQSDIVQDLEGTVYIEDNKAEFSVKVKEDTETEVQENMTFSINAYSAQATVIILADSDTPVVPPDDDDDDDDPGTPDFDDPIVDDNGGIIDITVRRSGRRFTGKPFISLESNTGFGGYVEPVINSGGYLTRVKVIYPGQGYTGQKKKSDVVCQLVGFAITNVGGLYDRPPTVYVNGDSSIAKATISEQGFVDGIELLKSDQNFEVPPTVIITGGGGFGAQAKADLQCVPIESSNLILQGLARDPANYVDCP
tara:strand:- start:68405 stop:71659 length:3255 start_codon:yes stop_codon:yes gene_type:complete